MGEGGCGVGYEARGGLMGLVRFISLPFMMMRAWN